MNNGHRELPSININPTPVTGGYPVESHLLVAYGHLVGGGASTGQGESTRDVT